MNQIGKILIFSGIIFIILGLLFTLSKGKLDWLGRLPGDIRIEKENFKFYFPITTMILISVILTLLIRLFKRLF